MTLACHWDYRLITQYHVPVSARPSVYLVFIATVTGLLLIPDNSIHYCLSKLAFNL